MIYAESAKPLIETECDKMMYTEYTKQHVFIHIGEYRLQKKKKKIAKEMMSVKEKARGKMSFI